MLVKRLAALFIVFVCVFVVLLVIGTAAGLL
jgi:hypothetical protein